MHAHRVPGSILIESSHQMLLLFGGKVLGKQGPQLLLLRAAQAQGNERRGTCEQKPVMASAAQPRRMARQVTAQTLQGKRGGRYALARGGGRWAEPLLNLHSHQTVPYPTRLTAGVSPERPVPRRTCGTAVPRGPAARAARAPPPPREPGLAPAERGVGGWVGLVACVCPKHI